ncbi:MAG: 3-dehydroquinate synthase [Chitinophagales bacterium]|nr:3-dehydroquinate synthase [Chitinophagales bacterium]
MDINKLKNYSIYITEKFHEQVHFRAFLTEGKYASIFILADENTNKFCLPLLIAQLSGVPFHIILIRSGESEKNIETCKMLWARLIEENAGRKSVLINLGGGVIGDMGGFVASTFKRGFDFINIPTTLLSQVDASVGGKLGIDFDGIKNIIGVFNDPKAVFISTEFLQTLPYEQLRSGFAEVLKHGLIRNKNYFDEIRNIDIKSYQNWSEIVSRSVEIKKQVVEKDPLEKDLRKILNFGHTIGHAIETLSLTRDEITPLLHGEAIAIGMICEAWLSSRGNNLPEEELNAIVKTISNYFNHHDLKKMKSEDIITLMKQDKKNFNEHISLSLLNKIGDCGFDLQVDEKLIKESLEYYKKLS